MAEALKGMVFAGNHQTVAFFAMVHFTRLALGHPVLVAADTNRISSYHTLVSRLQPACRQSSLITAASYFIYTDL
jgi:hypothetical protein